ncbi:hypothetical protein QJS04_geneDACA016159 [Acorus gramineus]|uniref:Maintenance of Photosystem II under High light 2 C-terminal domain-containing protein n=1 Tax=Acorus gramineus TaxID=55184 RepID=A0AAV9AKT1_ACOGR|nr:hypothetical protein QJS04_geneDACA016159 [Acorus gramineus]
MAFTTTTTTNTATFAPPVVVHRPTSGRPNRVLCQASSKQGDPSLTRRGIAAAAAAFLTAVVGVRNSNNGMGVGEAEAAILEADDDVELLERVKKDRQKRLERQGVISSSNKETGYLQELVYKLSKVAQAIEKNDLSTATSVLGTNTNSDWVKNINEALTKLSSTPEEMVEVDTFNSSLASLISSVNKKDIESSKLAFISSADALEKWIVLTGLVGTIKGL